MTLQSVKSTHMSGNVDGALTLRNASNKLIRYESHTDFLNTCCNVSVIPNGFRLTWDIKLDESQEEKDKCVAVKKDAALRLMEVSRNMCYRKSDELRHDISEYIIS
jgi:hypothetical protein